MYKRFMQLLQESNKTPYRVAKDTGVTQTTLSDWKTGRATPKAQTLQKIADYFNVSLDYLMGKSKYKNLEEAIDCNWGLTSNPDFDAAFNFADLLKDDRQKQGVSLAEMGAVIGCTEKQYDSIEQGLTPISEAQANKLCEFLGTNVSQVLFDNGFYDGAVPEIWQDDVKGYEEACAAAEDEAMRSNISEIYTNSIYQIPVFNSVSAGFGAYASDFIEGYIPTYLANRAEAGEYIWINVKGDSMHPRIMDGDRILVRRQTSVDSGSVAVLLLDGDEGLVKKVEYGPDWIDLISFNPEYPVKHFKGADVQRLQVVGVVKEVSRRL